MDVIDVEARVVTPAAGVHETSLIVTPKPLTLEGQRVLDVREAALMPGDTLAVFLARHSVEPGQQWVVLLGGVEVPETRWHLVRPKHGWIIEARRVPERSALALVAVLALSYFTLGAGGAAGGAFLGLTGGAAYVAAGAAYLAGSLVINKLLGPKAISAGASSAQKESPTYALQGGRNRSRPFETMGLVLGQPYCVPDLSAQPFTYFSDDEQYLWQVFHAGLNCASVSAIRIGDTLATSYQDVTLSYDGFPSGNTGLPALAGSVDTVAGALLDAPTAPGPWTTRTTSLGTVQIAIDLDMSLSVIDDRGQYLTANLRVELQYRPVGSSAWIGLDAPLFKSNSSKPMRRTLTYSFPSGQYEIRARKFGDANYTGAGQSNVVTWTTLKSYQVDTGNYGAQARVGIQIKATGQLNGSIDELNWQATGKPMPYWDGTQWTTATSRENGLSNPGALILLLARGIRDDAGNLVAGLGYADNLIDIESLKGFMVFCKARGFSFDYFLQENMSIGELIETVAAAGLGSRSWHTGRLGVIWYSDDQPVEGVFNMSTLKAKSFSVDYDTPATAEEIEFQYFDRERNNSWQSIRVLAPGVTTPTSTARQQLIGVGTEVQAGILARFSMAQNVYQRETVNGEVDLEHLVVRRGTVVALSHDMTQWGFGGRLRAASIAGSTVTLSLDEFVPSSSPTGATTRYIGLRLPGERAYRVFPVQAFTGETRTLVLSTAWPTGVPVPGASPSNPAEDTVWIYDFKATPGRRLRIADLGPQGNMEGARLALVSETPEFWNYVWTGSYLPPPNDSLLAIDLPVVQNLRITRALRRVGDGWATDLTATFDVLGNYGSAQLWAGADGAQLARIGNDIFTGSVTWTVPQNDQVWTVEIRPFDPLGRPGVKASTQFYDQIGEVAPVSGLSITVAASGILAKWQAPTGLNAIGWAVTQLRKGDAYATAVPVFEGRADSVLLPWLLVGTHKYWAAHKNTSGEWSQPEQASITILAPNQPIPNYDISKSGQVVIRWADCKTTQPIDYYEVRRGAVFADAEVIVREKSTTTSVIQKDFGEVMYWVVAVDIGGNRGPQGYVSALTLASYDSDIGSIRGAVQASLDEVLALQMLGVLNGDEQLQRVRAGIYERVENLTTDTTALASRYNAVAATVNENQAVVSTKITTLADTQSAQARSIEIVAASANTALAGVVTETNARVTAVQAVATQVTTVQSSVGTLSGTVEVQSNTLANLNGNVAAQHMIRTEVLTALGRRAMAGLSLGVSSTGGGTTTQSEAIVFADRFIVVADANATTMDAPFRVENGVVYINIAKIKNADIDTLKVAGYALSITLPASGAGVATIAFTVPAGQIWRATAIAIASNGATVERSNLNPYMATLSLTGAAAQQVMASVVGGAGSGETGTSNYRSPPFVNASVVDYPAGARQITATYEGEGAAPLVTLLVTLEKRGA